METIRELTEYREFEKCSQVIRDSFITVARDMGLTPDIASRTPAFITTEGIWDDHRNNAVRFFGLFLEENQIGCVALEKASSELYYLRRLAVLPDYRHRGTGRQLIDFCFAEVKKLGGKEISLGLMDKNRVLKEWYLAYGFQITEIKKFPHLPFTVCFMKKSVA